MSPRSSRAFGDKDYWLARLAAYGGDSMTLDSLDVDPDGAVVVTTTQDLRQDGCLAGSPSAAERPQIVRTEIVAARSSRR